MRSRKNLISYFNVMLVGYSGVGKTSFLRTLLESLEEQRPTITNKRRRDSAISETVSFTEKELRGPIEKTTQPYTVSKEIQVDQHHIILTLIDTPGFSAEFLVDRQLHDIIKYIEHQFDLTLEEESKVKRNTKAVDTQVHCCIYFIDPKKPALDEFDIRILKKLTKRVNVIPVIGKADNLTLAQRNRLKPSILQDIFTTHKIPVYCMPLEQEDDQKSSLQDLLSEYNYEEEDYETQSILDYLYTVPFTFIAYEEDPQSGKPIQINNTIKLGRDFGWGVIDCLDEKYSDFSKLKNILLSTHRRFLQLDTMERYYEKYRTERLLIRRATRLGLDPPPSTPTKMK